MDARVKIEGAGTGLVQADALMYSMGLRAVTFTHRQERHSRS